MSPDTRGWKKIGSSSNAEFFEIAPGLLAVVPHDGTTDDARTAAESVAVQLEYLRATASRAGVLVFMDRVSAQDAGARNVYRDAPDPAHQACFALVGGTPFGRAVASLFVGLNRPRVPTRFFATAEEAMTWARAMATTK
jgi:hypothetical protein